MCGDKIPYIIDDQRSKSQQRGRCVNSAKASVINKEAEKKAHMIFQHAMGLCL